MANQTYSNVSLLTFLHPILDKLSEGKVIRNSIAFALQVLGILNVVAGIYLIVEILKAAFRIESTGATIGGLLFVVFSGASVLAIQQICSYRARSIRALGDSPFTVIPIFSILMRATGEMLAVSWIAFGVGGCLLLWFGGEELLRHVPMAGSPELFGLDYREGSFIAGVLFLFSNGLLAFLALIFFYFLAEVVVVGVDIARNVRLLLSGGVKTSGAVVAEGSAASPHPFPVTEQSSASVDFATIVAPLTGWIAANRLLAGGIVGAAILLFAVYKLFLQADPIKDAKRVAEAYCECGKATTERLLAKEKEFLTRLNAGTFKIRSVAQSEHDHVIESDQATFLKCSDMAYTLHNEARSRFEQSAEDLYKFESALAEQRSLCADERANELNDVRSQVQMRIRALPYYAQQEAEPPPPMEQDAAAPSTSVGFITGDGVRLRSEPSTEGIIITKFAKGTQVELLEWLEGWVRIRYQGYEGYVSADFIRQ